MEFLLDQKVRKSQERLMLANTQAELPANLQATAPRNFISILHKSG
jgi:hypothetical protein